MTGALGQIGSELVPALRARYGADNVIATDLKVLPPSGAAAIAPYESSRLHRAAPDARGGAPLRRRHDLPPRRAALGLRRGRAAARLERQHERPLQCARGGARLRLPGVLPQLDRRLRARRRRATATPQVTVQRPTTIYGVTKVAGELLCDYYATRFGIDTRGLRLPGLISYVAAPGGGTTDYAVEMFYHALRHGRYTCFLVGRHPPRHDVHARRDRRR